MNAYTEHGTPCNQTESATPNADRSSQRLNRTIGTSLTYAPAMVIANRRSTPEIAEMAYE